MLRQNSAAAPRATAITNHAATAAIDRSTQLQRRVCSTAGQLALCANREDLSGDSWLATGLAIALCLTALTGVLWWLYNKWLKKLLSRQAPRHNVEPERRAAGSASGHRNGRCPATRILHYITTRGCYCRDCELSGIVRGWTGSTGRDVTTPRSSMIRSAARAASRAMLHSLASCGFVDLP